MSQQQPGSQPSNSPTKSSDKFEAASPVQTPPVLSSKQAYKRLLFYIKPHAFVFIFTVIGFIIAAMAEGASAWFVGKLADVLEGRASSDWRLWMPVLFFVIMASRNIGNFIGNYSMAYIGRKVVHTLRCEVFDKMLRLPSRFYQNNTVGRLLSRLTYDVEQVAALSSNVFKVVISDGLKLIGLLGYLLYLNWKLTCFILLIVPLIAWVVGVASKRFRLLSKRIQETVGDVAQISQEAITGQQEVKVYSGQDYESGRFEKASRLNSRQSLKLALTHALNTPIVQIMSALPLAIIIWFALQPSFVGEFTTAEFISFFTAVGLIVRPLRSLTSINKSIQAGIAGSQSLFQLLDTPEENDSGKETLKSFDKTIEFKNVSFSYFSDISNDSDNSASQVLKDVSLTIHKGQTVAFVGRSGSGKTTLVSTLPRFYDITQGNGDILIDGKSIRSFSLRSLRGQIALVNQQVVLFDGSIKNNIAYGELNSHELIDVEKAAASAYAHDFIMGTSQAYETQIGQNGVQLSGGQRQRVAIARAMLKQASILILDEATSALDSESENYIQQAVESLMGQTTMLVIAHRLSTVRNADVIVVMDNGRIIEQGSHEELLEKGGAYADLYNQQYHQDDM